MKFTNLVEQKEIKSNLSGDSFSSEISDPKLMMLIVRDKLYSHKLRTPIQEYISNAIDAQREANTQHLPIKIVLPTNLEPVLKIRDFGTGMSEEKVRKTFSQYTASDKRSNLSVIGGYGLGSKSAFAYTDKFTIISYHNGEMHSYLAYAPSELDLLFTPLFKGPTQEPNGVEIQIAIKPADFAEAQNSVLRIALLMPVKPNIINFHDFDSIYNDFKNNLLFSTKHFRIYNDIKSSIKNALCDSNYNNLFINYNGIPYSNIKNKESIIGKFTKNLKNRSLFIELIAEANTLSVPPAREMLTEDEQYLSFLDLISQQAESWNRELYEKEKTEICQFKILSEFDSFYPTCLCYHEEILNLTKNNVTLNVKIQPNKEPILLLKEDLYLATRKQYRGKRENTATLKYNTYVPEKTPTEEEKNHYNFKPNEYKERLSELTYNFAKTAFLKVDEYFKTLSVFHANKVKHFLESHPEIEHIIFVTANSALSSFAELHINDVKKAGNSRDLLEYYTFKYEYGEKTSKLTPGLVHFNNTKTYRYIKIEEGTTSFEIEEWLYKSLKKNEERIIFVTNNTFEKIKNRKKFIEVNLEAELNKNPNTKLNQKEKEAVAICRFFEKNASRFSAESHTFDFLKNNQLDNKLGKEVTKITKKYLKLAEQYDLSLLEIPGIVASYYHSYDENTHPYVKELLVKINNFLIDYPLFNVMAKNNQLENMNQVEVSALLEYIELKTANLTAI